MKRKKHDTPIGIITAMQSEARHLLKFFGIIKTKFIGGQTFYCGRISGEKVVISVCGVGKVFAAICTQTMITRFYCKHIINIGVAGALKESIGINDIVLASDVVEYDMDTSALGDPVGMISGLNIVNIPCDKNEIPKLKSAAEKAGINNFIGTVATGDRFFKDEATRSFIHEKFGAYAGEMEGAAVGQVCCLNKIPFNVVRIISDKAGENSCAEYGSNLETATKMLCDIMEYYFVL